VPTDEPFADPPSGLTTEEITDPQALAAAHVRGLNNSSFTVRRMARWQYQNGTEAQNVTS
jgi:hypothetical protein